MKEKEIIERFEKLSVEWFGEYGFSKKDDFYQESGKTELNYMQRVGIVNWCIPIIHVEEDGFVHELHLFQEDNETKGYMEINLHILTQNAFQPDTIFNYAFSLVKKYFPDAFFDFDQKEKEYFKFYVKKD